MPNGNTAMQYPFPYKNISGSSDIITSGTFVVVTTGTLDVTGNANISGTTTTSILVVTGTATSAAWDGSNNINANDFSSQTNTSTGNAAAATYRVYNGSDDTFDFSIYSRIHTTYPGLAVLLTSRSIKIHTNVPGNSIKLTTNFIDRVTVSDSGVVLSAPLPISSGGFGITTIGTNGQVPTSNGTGYIFTTPAVGSVTSVGLSMPSVFNITGTPVTSSGTLAVTWTTSGANSVMLRDASQNVSVNQLTSSVLTGTSPLVVSSSTIVGNLNANYLNGVGFAIPAVSSAVELDASAQFVTAAITGTGSYVKSTSAALTTPNIGSASGSFLTLSGLTASYSVHTNGTKTLVSVLNTGTGNNVLSANPVLTGTITAAAINFSGNINSAGLTASSAVATNASKDLVSVATTGTGSYVLAASPTLTGTLTAATGTFSGNVTAASYVGSTTTFSAATTVDIAFDTSTFRKIVIDVNISNSTSGGSLYLRTAAGIPDGFSIIRRATVATEIRATDGLFMNGANSGDQGGSCTITIYRPVTSTTGQVQVYTTGTYYFTGDGPASVGHWMLFAQNYSTNIRLFRDNGTITGSYTIRNFS